MSKSKGRRTVNKAIDHYKQEGYLVDKVELGGRFTKSKDLFSGICWACGAEDVNDCTCEDGEEDFFPGFDLIAIRDGVVKLIQVKTNRPPTQSDYLRFSKKFASRYIHVESFTWYDYSGPRIQRYCKNGSIMEKDLR